MNPDPMMEAFGIKFVYMTFRF